MCYNENKNMAVCCVEVKVRITMKTEFEKIDAKKAPKEKIVYVGDGINDAPVIARADIGIAMGAMGSDAAIESADIVLLDDEPTKIADAFRISKSTKRIVVQNIVFALGVKIGFMILGAFGMANMWEAEILYITDKSKRFSVILKDHLEVSQIFKYRIAV